MRYALLVFLAACRLSGKSVHQLLRQLTGAGAPALLLAVLTYSVPARGDEARRGQPGSVYVPPCLDLRPKPRSQNPNSILVMTGPARDRGNLFIFGYSRRFKPDLSLGFQIMASDRNGYEGAALGLQYHFGDPE